VAERLRIALITERFGYKFGGAEAYAVHLFEKISRTHQVTVIAREFDHNLPINELRVPRLKGWPSWLRALHFAYWARRLCRSRFARDSISEADTDPSEKPDFDVVHTHAMGPAGDIHVVHVVPFKFRRFCMQSRWRGLLSCLQPRNLAYLWLEAASVRSRPGRRLVAVSPSVETQLYQAYPALKKVEIIPPGASPVTMDRSVRKQLRDTFGWDDSDVGCLLVARNPLRKGMASTLEALAHLPKHYKLVVVGADVEARTYLNAHHPELNERVRLVGPVTEVSPYYLSADIYVHPTLRDSFGMAPLEAMAHGLPVVLSEQKYCGFAAFVRHQHEAWILDDPKDALSVAEALRALAPGERLREDLVRQSARVVERFSWDGVATRYEDLYQALHAERMLAQSQPRTQ
jgi:glycosyltransferase involved in cell wall biosynthesis